MSKGGTADASQRALDGVSVKRRERAELVAKRWQGEQVLYDRQAGDLHYLDAEYTLVLEALVAGETITVAELKDRLTLHSTPEVADNAITMIATIIDKLSQLQLIEITE